MALIAGVQVPVGRVMGHAGAILRDGESSAKAKIKLLEDSGVLMVNHPSKFGEGMKKCLSGEHEHNDSVKLTSTTREDPNATRKSDRDMPEEIEAEKYGIIYRR